MHSFEIGIGSIGQIALEVSDIRRAVSFYRDMIGLPLLFEVPPSMAFFDCDGIRLMLQEQKGEISPSHSIIYFKVDEIVLTYETLEKRGVTFLRGPQLTAKMPDHELWMAFFEDFDGNRFALMSEISTSLSAQSK